MAEGLWAFGYQNLGFGFGQSCGTWGLELSGFLLYSRLSS